MQVKEERVGFDLGEYERWQEEWQDMPEYSHEDLESFKEIIVHFETPEDVQKFSELIDQKILATTKSVWYPKADILHHYANRWVDGGDPVRPLYPIYVISKGRWESRMTSKALEKMDVPYFIVVESQEYDQYASVIDSSKILVLPFSDLGEGSIPARNWVWEHSIRAGFRRHWILDDNIDRFDFFNHNLKTPVRSGAMFRAAEDFVKRYENVALAGFQYDYFAPAKNVIPPFALNTRIYSCILIKNDIPYRWRGKYNEDTDLSIRVLKDGWCTVLFYAFLQEKTPTMMMKGGNMDELYQGDGRLKMAESLAEQHPDVTTVIEKWGRFQHQVDYRPFRHNKLIKKKGLVVSGGVNNYGMVMKRAADCEDEKKIRRGKRK
jgi:hypothetical protein